MPKIFTPNEAAALIEISPKRIYKEIEHRIIHAETPNHHQLSFGTLVYLRALKEINFDFSVSYRIHLHEAIQTAWTQQVATLELFTWCYRSSQCVSDVLSPIKLLHYIKDASLNFDCKLSLFPILIL